MQVLLFLLLTALHALAPTHGFVTTPLTSSSFAHSRNAFVADTTKRSQSRKFLSSLQMAQLGLHGENFKYLSIMKGKSSQHFPRTIPIAGMYPEVTPEDVLAPAQCPLIMPGQIAFDFSDLNGPQLGTVAVPGSDVMTFADDPVALVAHNSDLGIKVSSPEGAECVAIVDRDDIKFNPDFFYAFRSPSNTLEIGSTDRIEQGYEILGRIITVMVPYIKGDKKAASGFAEEEEED